MMDITWLSAILVGAGCLALGYCIGECRPAFIFFRARMAKESSVGNASKKNKPKEPLEIEKLAAIMDDFKMV